MYDLVGVDGNAFAIIGYVTRAMREVRFNKEDIDAYKKRATSGDYNNLLAVSIEMTEKCNEKMNAMK